MALGADETAEGITARTGFVAKAQLRAEMSGRESLDELEHVVVRATDEAVTAHLRGVTRRQGNGNGIVVHVQADEQDSGRWEGGGLSEDLCGTRRSGGLGPWRCLCIDRREGPEYVGLHGICFPFY